MNCYHFIGLITTTSRKLDREQQDEHILEVSVSLFLIIFKILSVSWQGAILYMLTSIHR